MVIDPPKSGPNLRGYIDQATPHSINRILVDFLGSEEIVLVCCDDGDVIGYKTDAIKHAIDRRAVPNELTGLPLEELKPFFLENVGMSAWGLAVHSEARMVAVCPSSLTLPLGCTHELKGQLQHKMRKRLRFCTRQQGRV